jgi:transcriptional regulator with XRE-family HTH domain
MTNDVGQYIREMRQAAGLTLVEMSQLTGLSPGFISDIERGARRMNPMNAANIADALHIARAELVQPVLERLLDGLDLDVKVTRKAL